MHNEKYITFFSEKKENILEKNTIIYVITGEKHKTQIYTLGGEVYETRMTLGELEKSLGDEFVKIRRNTLVRASEIMSIADSINLKNGDKLKYTIRQKRRIIDEVLRITAKEENVI